MIDPTPESQTQSAQDTPQPPRPQLPEGVRLREALLIQQDARRSRRIR